MGSDPGLLLSAGVPPRVRGQLLPTLLSRSLQAVVGAGRDGLELTLELPPAPHAVEFEAPVVDRRKHRAARLACVRAVAKAAPVRERLDVLEGGADVAVPELELTQAGRVDGERAAGQLHELTVRRRVPPGAVFRERSSTHHLRAGKAIQ